MHVLSHKAKLHIKYVYFVCIFVVVLNLFVIAENSENQTAVPWDYLGNNGPDHWYVNYPQCSGSSQSPVSINTKMVVLDRDLTKFQLDGYGSINNVNMSLKNNGHTVQIDIGNSNMTVCGGGLPSNEYVAAQFHFHWGAKDSRGSEHDINGYHFPMEMHIVHFSQKYTSLQQAMTKPDGLMVMGVFFEIGDYNENFHQIIAHFKEIKHKGESISIPAVRLGSLLPDQLEKYFRYRGSLTTPPCFESVLWTVFLSQNSISKFQLEEFRHTVKKNKRTEPDFDLNDDFRPTQPLNHRTIYGSHPDTQKPLYSGTAMRASSNVLTLFSFSMMIANLLQG